jgi:hypothetical protein
LPIVATMLRLTKEQRCALSETLRDLANLAAAALVLGQFVGERPRSGWLLCGGVALWLALVALALLLERTDG